MSIFASITFLLLGGVYSSIKYYSFVSFSFEFGYFSEDTCFGFFGFIVVSFGGFSFDDHVVFQVEFYSLFLGFNDLVFLVGVGGFEG